MKSDETVQAEIPAQLAGSTEEIAALKEQAESAGQASSVGIGGGFVVNLLFASSLQMLWGLVNTLQVLTALVFMRVYVPENAMLVNMALLDSANLNILPMEAVFEFLFPWLFADAKPEATDSIIGSPIEEIGNFLVIIIGILSMIPLIWVYIILNKRKKSEEISQFVFFSGSLQLYMESYLQIVLSCLIVFRAGLDNETGSQIFRSVFVSTALLGCVLIPGLVSAYLQINRGRFHKKAFHGRFASVIGELNHKQSLSSWLFSLYCYRRLILGLLIVFMSRYSYAQVQLICFATGIGFILFHAINPIKSRVIYNLEMFNEVCILLCIYHHFCFTDFVPEPEARYVMGQSLVNMTLFNLGANMFFMVQSVVRDICFKAKRLRYKLRNKRILLMRKLKSQ